MEKKIRIAFGNLKPEIKSNFYLGGNERFCENKTLDVIISIISTTEKFQFNKYIKVPIEDYPYINRLVNINYFETIEIIN